MAETVFDNVPDKDGKIYCHKQRKVVNADFEELRCFRCDYLNGCDNEGNIECVYDAGSENRYQQIFSPEKHKKFVLGDE